MTKTQLAIKNVGKQVHNYVLMQKYILAKYEHFVVLSPFLEMTKAMVHGFGIGNKNLPLYFRMYAYMS